MKRARDPADEEEDVEATHTSISREHLLPELWDREVGLDALDRLCLGLTCHAEQGFYRRRPVGDTAKRRRVDADPVREHVTVAAAKRGYRNWLAWWFVQPHTADTNFDRIYHAAALAGYPEVMFMTGVWLNISNKARVRIEDRVRHQPVTLPGATVRYTISYGGITFMPSSYKIYTGFDYELDEIWAWMNIRHLIDSCVATPAALLRTSLEYFGLEVPTFIADRYKDEITPAFLNSLLDDSKVCLNQRIVAWIHGRLAATPDYSPSSDSDSDSSDDRVAMEPSARARIDSLESSGSDSDY